MKKKIILSSILALGVLGGVVGLAHGPVGVEAANVTGGTILYLKPNSNWTQANARFAMYLCNGTSSAVWVDMKDEDGDGNYQATVPSGQTHKNVIFCRMNPSSSTNDWNNKWNQTGDLTWDGSKNLCSINSGQWDCGTNVTWSKYEPKHYIVGTMNDWEISDDFKMISHTTANEHKFEDLYLESGAEIKIKAGEGKNVGYFGYETVKDGCKDLVNQAEKDGNIKITQTGVYDFYWDYSSNQLWISFDKVSSVVKLLTDYYNKGTYTRQTTINVDKDNIEKDLGSVYSENTGKYENLFHANSTVLKRTTYFEGDALWMTNEEGTYSYYGTSGDDMTGGRVASLEETSSTIAKAGVGGMEEYYTTLKDIMEKASTVEWTYSNGVYSTTGLTEEFLAFTAPCFLNFDNEKISNYFALTSVEIEETNEGLELRLITSGDSGKLIDTANNVLSEAIITYEA